MKNNTIFIDENGSIVSEGKHSYKVTLNGSYSYCGIRKIYTYEIEKVEPFLPLKKISHEKKLLAGF